MHRLISNLLCIDLPTTLHLSRIIRLNKITINSKITNLEEGTSLRQLVYDDGPIVRLWSNHQCCCSIIKVVNRRWNDITFNDMHRLCSIKLLRLNRRYCNIHLKPLSNTIEIVLIKNNDIYIRAKISSDNGSNMIIRVRFYDRYFTVSESIPFSNDTSYTSLPISRRYIYDVNDTRSTLRTQGCNIS